MKNLLKECCLFVLFFILSACITVSPDIDGRHLSQGIDKEDFAIILSDHIEALRQNYELNGLSVAVVLNDEILLSEGFGLMDVQKNKPISADTIIPIGSISKMFTAVAIMQLVEQEVIALDEAVSSYIPELKNMKSFDKSITVRQLLTHHSGLVSFINAGSIVSEAGDYHLEKLLYFIDQAPNNLKPGEMFAYGNTSYALLGLLIQRVTPATYSEFIGQRIFSAANMENTMTFPDTSKIESFSKGYNGHNVHEYFSIRDISAGGFASTADDMGNFIIELLSAYNGNSDILSQKSYQEMLIRQNKDVAIDRDFSIGLGWWLVNPVGIPALLASHGGEMDPFNAFITTAPEHGLGVFIANNTGGDKAGAAVEIGTEIMRILYEWKSGMQIDQKSSVFPVEVPGNELEKLIGHYSTSIGLIEVEKDHSDLKCRLFGQELFLVPLSNGTFYPEFRLFGLVPLDIKELKQISIEFFNSENGSFIDVILGGVFHNPGERLRAGEAVEGSSEFAGRFKLAKSDQLPGYIMNPEIAIYFDEKSHFYLLSYSYRGMNLVFPLQPLSQREAEIAGHGAGLGERLELIYENGVKKILWKGFVFHEL